MNDKTEKRVQGYLTKREKSNMELAMDVLHIRGESAFIRRAIIELCEITTEREKL